MKLKNIIGILAILVIIYNVYTNFNIDPDLTLTKWVGYKFGFNYNDNLLPKAIAIVLIVIYGLLAQKDFD
jgi:hypothetical protein